MNAMTTEQSRFPERVSTGLPASTLFFAVAFLKLVSL